MRIASKDSANFSRKRIGPAVQASPQQTSGTIVQPRAPGKIDCGRFNISITNCSRTTIASNVQRVDFHISITGGGRQKYALSTPHEKAQFHGPQVVLTDEVRVVRIESLDAPFPSKIKLVVEPIDHKWNCPARLITLPC